MSLADVLRKHTIELANWAKKLTDCEAARSLEVECKVRFESNCGRLQDQLKLVVVQLEELRARAKKAEAAYQQLGLGKVR